MSDTAARKVVQSTCREIRNLRPRWQHSARESSGNLSLPDVQYLASQFPTTGFAGGVDLSLHHFEFGAYGSPELRQLLAQYSGKADDALDNPYFGNEFRQLCAFVRTPLRAPQGLECA